MNISRSIHLICAQDASIKSLDDKTLKLYHAGASLRKGVFSNIISKFCLKIKSIWFKLLNMTGIVLNIETRITFCITKKYTRFYIYIM